MSQPEESRPKTAETDDVVSRPHRNRGRRLDQVAPRPASERGEVRVERDGQVRPLRPDEVD